VKIEERRRKERRKKEKEMFVLFYTGVMPINMT
jgi:hypothetical protein